MVDQALAALREQGVLSPEQCTKVEAGAPPPGPDDPMEGRAESLGSMLDSNAAFKQTWDAMLQAGGDEARQWFAPIMEARAKRARATPYDKEEQKEEQPSP